MIFSFNFSNALLSSHAIALGIEEIHGFERLVSFRLNWLPKLSRVLRLRHPSLLLFPVIEWQRMRLLWMLTETFSLHFLLLLGGLLVQLGSAMAEQQQAGQSQQLRRQLSYQGAVFARKSLPKALFVSSKSSLDFGFCVHKWLTILMFFCFLLFVLSSAEQHDQLASGEH